MDEGQLMKPCTSFYTSSQAFKLSNPLWLCFFPPFLKVGSTSNFFNSKMWSSRKRNPNAFLILTACKGHTENSPGTVSTPRPRTRLSKFRQVSLLANRMPRKGEWFPSQQDSLSQHLPGVFRTTP